MDPRWAKNERGGYGQSSYAKQKTDGTMELTEKKQGVILIRP
jgi:hypothetical protein